MQKFGLTLMVGLLATCGFARPAAAIMPFHKQFIKLYLGEDANQDSELATIAADKKKKCLVCHQGKKKKNRNPYGQQLSMLLDKKKDKKDLEKIVASLKAVAEMRRDPNDESSPTFGELIAEGKLPGGSLEALLKEPAEEKDKDNKG